MVNSDQGVCKKINWVGSAYKNMDETFKWMDKNLANIRTICFNISIYCINRFGINSSYAYISY